MKKECFKCGKKKSLGEFYEHPEMKDGHVNKCKECNKADVRENRKSNVEYYREYDRTRGSRQSKEYRRDYRKRFPNKYKAQCAVGNAIRDGRLERGKECEVCESKNNLHAHHDDYFKPLSVRWLCAVCHKAWHLVNGEGKNP